MPLTAGSRLGPYEILSALGEGGMGEVYRALDTKLHREVAIKILPEAFAADAERLARFKREAQVLAALDHPNIGAIYGFEDSDGVHALVLQLVEGPTLADRISEGPIPVDEALSIAKQIAEALEAAHEQGIIHRDLKPANVKVTPDDRVKVLDFGLAKLFEPDKATAGQPRAYSPAFTNSPTLTTPAMTQMGVILGTATYMSPEQAKGRPADRRSDIWAFGCVLFEMLTAKRAFDGEDVTDTIAAVVRGEPDWSALPADVPQPVDTLVRRCLAKDPRQRVGAIAVAQFLLSDPNLLAATRQASGPAVTRGVSRSQLAFAVVAATLVVATIAGIVAWRLWPATPPSPVVRFSWTLAQHQASFLITRQSMAISPDGMQIVYVAGNQLFRRSLADEDSAPIGGTFFGQTTAVMSPAFSPDGRTIAFWAQDAIKRIPVTGGVASTICPAAAPSGLSWDASGVVFGQLSRGVWRCVPTGGQAQQLATVKTDEQADGPQVLFDGKALLFTVAAAEGGPPRWDQARIIWQSLTTGEQKLVINGGSAGRYLPTGHLLYAVGGVMLAVPFDAQRGAVLGDAAPVIEGVRRSRGGTVGIAHLVTSATGVMAYMPGPANAATNQNIAVADRAGSVSALPMPPGPYVEVRASRDGATLAVASDDGTQRNVWISPLRGAVSLRRLTFEGRNQFPVLSPDGVRVAYQSDREGDQAIYVGRADGTGQIERLTKPGQGETHLPESWSPDGRYLAYSAGKPGAFSLWILSFDDHKAVRLGDTQSRSPFGSSFSPDGHWIAYYVASTSISSTGRPIADVGQLSSDIGVFIQPFPPTGARYQVPKQQIDFHPVWTPDSGSLIFTPSANSGQLNAISITTRPALTFGNVESVPARVTADRIAAESRAWDILPDGRFVGLVPAVTGSDTAGSDTHIRVVLNWLTELKQRVPLK